MGILSSLIFGSLEFPPSSWFRFFGKIIDFEKVKKIALKSAIFRPMSIFSFLGTCFFFWQTERTTVQIMCKCLRFPQKPTDCHKFHNELTDLISFRFSDLEIIRNISRIYFFKDKKIFFCPKFIYFCPKSLFNTKCFCLSKFILNYNVSHNVDDKNLLL